MGCPLTLAVSGPITVSGQHHTWLIPLLETGWVAYLSTTDAVCYHDGHRSLDAYKSGPIHEVPINSDDADPTIVIPQASSATRFFGGAFLLFWLGGWFFGFKHAATEVMSGK